MPNNLSYTQLANIFREFYNDNSKYPDNQRQNFVLKLCGDRKEIYEIAKNIWDNMTNIYKNNISDKEKTNYIQDIKSNLCKLNKFLQSRFLINKKFLKYEDLLLLLVEIDNQGYKKIEESKSQFIYILSKNNESLFEVVEDLWFTVINIRDEIIAPAERNKYITSVNSKLDFINEFLYNQKPEESKSQFISILSKNNENLFEVVEDLWFTVINIKDKVIAPAKRNQYIASVNSKLDFINEFLYNQKDLDLKQGKNFCEMIMQQSSQAQYTDMKR